jgi:hypothetical protein
VGRRFDERVVKGVCTSCCRWSSEETASCKRAGESAERGDGLDRSSDTPFALPLLLPMVLAARRSLALRV